MAPLLNFKKEPCDKSIDGATLINSAQKSKYFSSKVTYGRYPMYRIHVSRLGMRRYWFVRRTVSRSANSPP